MKEYMYTKEDMEVMRKQARRSGYYMGFTIAIIISVITYIVI